MTTQERITRWVAAAANGDTQVALATIPQVELLEVGEDWLTSTGVFTWDERDLQSAIASQDDPFVRTPIIKLGHIDPRFDGQPTVGRVENLSLANNGQTLLGDLVGVPVWLAECMASAYPRRSIEGYFDYTPRSSQTWPFVLTGLALLGEAYPAIDSLEDVKALFGKEPPILLPVDQAAASTGTKHGEIIAINIDAHASHRVAAGANDIDDFVICLTCGHQALNHGDQPSGDNTGSCSVAGCGCPAMKPATSYGSSAPAERPLHQSPVTIHAAGQGVHADVSTDDVRTSFYDGPGGEPGHFWWWIREVRIEPSEVIVDDDEGHLLRVPYTIDGSLEGEAAVGWGDAQEVRIQYIDVMQPGQAAVASYGNPVAAGRPRARRTTAQATRRDLDVQLTEEQIRGLGLDPANATEEQISGALDERLSAVPSAPATPAVPAVETPAPSASPAEPATPAAGDDNAAITDIAARLPEGVILIDRAEWESVRSNAAAAGQFLQEQTVREHQRFVDEAIQAGKFPVSRREHWTALMSADPEGTRQIIAVLAEGTIPIKERGVAGSNETAEAQPSAYPASWKPSVAAASRRSRVRLATD